MKKGNPVSSRRTAGLFLVVAGCLGLLSLVNLSFASFTEIFHDDVNRNNGPIGNNWSGNATISNQSFTLSSNYLTRPEITLNGKMEVISNSSPKAVGLVARYGSQTSSYFYGAFAFPDYNGNGSGSFALLRCPNDVLGLNDGRGCSNIGGKTTESLPLTGMKLEFMLDTIGSTTNVIFNAYDLSGTLRETASTTVTDTSPQSEAQWGLSNIFPVGINDFKLYETVNIPNDDINVDKKTVKVGSPITVTISSDTADTFILDDGGQGGTFNPTSLTLNTGNGFTATATYIPATIGALTLTTSPSLDNNAFIDIFVLPYSPIIGFVGDSITASPQWQAAFLNSLSGEYSIINRGAGGSETISWVNNTCTQGPAIPDCMTQATTVFQNSGVDVVMLMLGTNDIGGSVSSDAYKDRLKTIINTLKTDGKIQKIILNRPIYSSSRDMDLLATYTPKLYELVDGETVMLGDIDAYDWFALDPDTTLNQVEVWSGVHPTTSGYISLGNFRANAFTRVIIEPLTMYHDFINGNNYTLSSSTGLVYQVDKNADWFTMGGFAGVEVDKVSLTSSDYYSSTTGSTTITLLKGYLDTLSTGNHLLTVKFADGVIQTGTFTILPAPIIPPIPTVPTTPSYAGGGGGGVSLVKDSCPNGDLSPSYYDKTCGTTTDLTEEVAKKVTLLRPIIKLIYLTATEEQKTFVHNLITSCSETSKNEVIKLACQELVENRDF